MITTILTVPTKSTTEVNWLKPLNNYLLSVYGNTSEFQDDLAKFNKSRSDLSGLGGDEKAVKAYFSYYSQLEILDLRVPVSKVNKRKTINFTWTDAFSPESEHEQFALPFEKASVLFNLGAVLTSASAYKYVESRKTDDDANFKLALQLMQQAAGVFQFLGDNFLHGPSSDLKPSTTRFLVQLCLAQSQEMFNLKVIDGDLEQKKNSLIAKLCSSTAKHYQQCHDVTKHLLTADGASGVSKHSTFAIKDSSLDDDILGLDSGDEASQDSQNDSHEASSVSSDLDHSWITQFQFKALYYGAMCFYFHGLHLEATGKYGEAIGYLTKSSDMIKDIPSTVLKTISKSRLENVYELLDNYKYQKDALEIKLRDLVKDNDLIYHDIVPSTVTLPEPKPMDSAKVIPMGQIEAFSQINDYHYNNFLKNVVPINIHELLSYYSEEKSQLLRNELDAFDVSNEELASAMEYLNLPKALVSIKELYNGQNMSNAASQSEIFLDSELMRKVSEIQQNSPEVQRNLKSIEQQRQNILQNIRDCDKDLNSAPTNMSHERFKDDIIKLKKTLFDGANSDTKLFSLINANNSGLYQILCKGAKSAEFANLFQVTVDQIPQNVEPEISLLDIDDFASAQKQNSVDSRIKHLEDLIYQVNSLKAKKQEIVDKLKTEIHSDDISDILLLNSKVKSTNEIKNVIFPDELKKFDVYSRALDEAIEKQKESVDTVRQAWEELVSDPEVRKIRESSTFKQNLYQEQTARINEFYDTWKKYSVGLQKGAEFYQRILSFSNDLRNALKKSIQGGDINGSMASLSIQSTGPQPQDSSDAYMAQRNMHSTSQHTGSSLSQQGFSDNLGHTGAPQLPPKRPSQSFTHSYTSSQTSSQGNTGPYQAPPLFNRQNSNEDELIYNQPSAYQPNIYDMFSKH